MVLTYLELLTRRRPAPRRGDVPRPCRRCPLMLERLEDRCVPTNFLWVGPNGGHLWIDDNWLSQTNPAAHGVPGAADTMVFAPDQTAGGTPGANTSPNPKDTIGGNQAGLVMSGAYTGTVAIINATLTITGSLTLQGGELGGANNGGNLVLDTAASGGTSIFGSMQPGANPVLDTANTSITYNSALKKNSVLNVQGPGSLNTTLANFGSLNFQAGGQGYTVSGPNLTNKGTGTVDLQGDGVTFGSGAASQFINYGTFKKSSGGGTSTWAGGQFTNYGWFFLNSGTVNLSNSSNLQSQYPNYSQPWTELNGGSLQVANPYLILAGWLDGVGTITGEVDNGDPSGQQAGAGYVHPGLLNNGQTPGFGGLLNITGDYHQLPAGVLWIDVRGSGSGIGWLNVQGVAYLAGSAHVVRDPNYSPDPAQQGPLVFLTYGAEEDAGFGADFVNNSWTVNGVNHSFAAQDGVNGINAWGLVIQ